MTQPLNVVITGASSGIGLATARAFAAKGARLVLAARGAEALENAAVQCRDEGGTVLAVPTDVTDIESVRRLADRAREWLGDIDLWASIVGVGVVGRYHEVAMAEHEAVIRANLLGHMNDAHAVLPIFLDQGRGTWVNMISVGGFVPTPFSATYGTSKYGLRGFSEALRAELTGHPRIHVCDVYPAFTDTAGIRHLANETGKKLSAPPPVLDARRVGAAVVGLATRPRATTMVGSVSYAVRLGHALAPRLVGAAMNKLIARYFARAEDAPKTRGSLHESQDGPAAIDGGLRSPKQRTIGLAAVGALAAGLCVFAFTRRRAPGE